ncbi:MAG: hypothetical protein IJK50_10460 [Prevotella sp.]|nr:hypothetical protein [Prevotella sp.]
MATLKLTIYQHKDLVQNIALDTSSLTANYKFKDAASIEHDYLFTLAGLDISMQMYRPSEIYADISIAMANGNDWVAIPRTCFEIFKDKRVGISSDSYEIGNDFYVHEVIPECYSDYMHLKLKIYSPDKMLTLRNTSRTFVGKRLSEILGSELGKYKHPADNSDCLKFNTDHLQVLKFEKLINENKVKVEHMFPFLVQYNESIYDLLTRTANRWGEFMYYRDGKLHFGYNANQKAIGFEEITKDKKKKVKYYKATFPSYNTDAELTNGDVNGVYDLEAVYDATVSDTPVEKSPYKVKGQLGMFNGSEDKYLMKKAASFLGNDKDLVTWLFNNLVDDSVSVAQSVAYKAQLNNDLNKKYFSDKDKYPVQYGKKEFTLYDNVKEEKEAFNEFTEFNSAYDAAKYQMILEAERTASKNLVQIDFDTTSPDVKLGDLIIVEGEQFIVVGITAKTSVTRETDKDTKKLTITTQQRFVVTAVGRKDEKSIFYPTMLPSGHVKYSGPQKGLIWDEDDPTLNHRVRVLFDWQWTEVKEKDENGKVIKVTIEPIDNATPSPWLIFAAKGDGKPSTGRHVDKTKVLVGFIDGNIERPYVMGAIQEKGPYDSTIDVDIDTDQGHHLRLTDGSRGAGLSSFLFGALSPAASTIADFVPDFAFNAGKSAHLEGGFSLSDFYGIYKISGSSDQRNITISSPWGDVKMNAFTGITISAPNGDVKISGKNVTIEAGNNLKLLSGTNVDYKFYQDKKYKGTSAATVLMSASAAIVSRLAKKFTMLDLSIVRSVVEIVMRPVEGALTVKSSRFLKLEAGKNACEYPKMAFDEAKKQKLIDAAAGKKLKGNTQLSQGLVNLFGIIPQAVGKIQEVYNGCYQECLNAKTGFENAIIALNELSENKQQNPCKGYSALQGILWNVDLKKDKIEENDLGFDDKLVGIKNDSPTEKTQGNLLVPKNIIITERKKRRQSVLDKAVTLRKSIIKILAIDINQKSANTLGQNVFGTVPKDAGTKLFNALCKDKNKDLFIYKPTDDIKSLPVQVPIGAKEVKFLNRVFTLKLLKEYELTKGATEPRITTPNGNGNGDIMDDRSWKKIVFEMKVVDASSVAGAKTNFEKWQGDMTGAIGTLLGDLDVISLVSRTKSAWDERHSWNHNNNGCILFGANDQTYMVGEGDTAQLSKIEKLTPKVPGNASWEFLDDLKKKLYKL